MKQNRVLPTFQCYSCTNCETDFHNDENIKKDIGFCLRFKENTPLEQKNLSCWTQKENKHYKDLFLQVEKSRTANKHIEVKQVQQLNLFFDNQINPFE